PYADSDEGSAGALASCINARRDGELRDDPDREAREAVSLMAGPLAQAHVTGVPLPEVAATWGQSDREAAWDACRVAGIEWRESWELAARFVRHAWPWIEAVRDALLERRVLSRAEVEALRRPAAS